MQPLALAALIHTQPEGPAVPTTWMEESLRAAFGPSAEPALRSWSVGGVQGTETLVQSRPVVRDPATRFVDDLLRAPSHCTIAGFLEGPADPAGLQRFGVSRFQRWIGIASEAEVAGDTPEAQATRRRRLRERLPDFLARSAVDGSDRELLFLTVLAAFAATTALGRTYADPVELRAALRSADQALESPAAIHLMISDGRTLGVLHRGGRMIALEAPPPARAARAVAPDRHHALLLLHAPTCESRPPPPGAEVVAEGIFTVSARHPVRIARD